MVVSTKGIRKTEKAERNTGKKDSNNKPYFLVFKTAAANFKGIF